MTALLRVDGLHVAYGRVEAVRGVSFEVQAGAIATIIGANGAGKTTLLKAVAGLLPSKGEVFCEGSSLRGFETVDRVGRGLFLVPEQRELFGAMSVADNLLLGGYSVRRDRAAIRHRFEEVYARFPRLAERRHQLAQTLSGGERQMLAIGRALMGKPKLLMLDEPSLGLAPLLVREIFEIIVDLRAGGVSLLVVEQNARTALETADHAYVMELGEVKLQGPAKELLKDPRVAETYLGKAVTGGSR